MAGSVDCSRTLRVCCTARQGFCKVLLSFRGVLRGSCRLNWDFCRALAVLLYIYIYICICANTYTYAYTYMHT